MRIDQEKIAAIFADNFAQRGELGASVSVWQNGEEIVSLAGGWRDREQTLSWVVDTPVLVWSVTKGLASACLLHALAAAGVELTEPVAAVWPEFGAAGKAEVTLAQLMSHRAGLAALNDLTLSVWDHAAVAAALAAQAPAWPVGEEHGYHPRTYGFLIDETLRRVCPGRTIASYWREEFAEPLGLELWIGAPESVLGRVANIYAARAVTGAVRPATAGAERPFYEALADEHSLTRRAFAAPRGLLSIASMNSPEARQAEMPSFSGIGTARALGKFYGMLAQGGVMDGRRYFGAETIGQMTRTLTSGPDRILRVETAFSAGYMKDPVGPDGRKRRHVFGPSPEAFGQPGAGGGHAFADPENQIAFAYVMNQMEPGLLPNAKSELMVDAVYGDGS